MQSNRLNVENITAEYIRRWIFILKEIRKKAEKYTNREDIRGYFITQRKGRKKIEKTQKIVGICLKYKFVCKVYLISIILFY